MKWSLRKIADTLYLSLAPRPPHCFVRKLVLRDFTNVYFLGNGHIDSTPALPHEMLVVTNACGHLAEEGGVRDGSWTYTLFVLYGNMQKAHRGQAQLHAAFKM